MRAHLVAMLVGFSGAAALLLGACLLPDFTVGETETTADAGTDVTEDVTEDTGPDVVIPPVCMRTTYPQPPGGGDAASMPAVVMALHQIDMGDSALEPPGFDLDYTCTCFEGAGDTCSTGSPTPRCDGEGGVDNAASKLFKLVTDNLGDSYFGSEFYSTRAHLGFWTLLIQLSEYNGLPDDPAVDVAIFVSPGMDPGVAPKWDGTDAWPVSSDSLGPSGLTTDPLYVSKGAYVADGVLVASLSTLALRLSGGVETIRVRLAGGVLSGKLTFDNGVHLTSGTIAGRWSETEVFASLASFRGQNGMLICNDAGIIYNGVKARVCSSLDILSDSIQAASSPCDALSLGVGFAADPALLGPPIAAAGETPGCAPDQDPTKDSCPK